MLDQNLWFTGADINYLMGQDALSYKIDYPPIPVFFIDREKTIVDEFNTQPVIALRDAVPVNVNVKFNDLKKIMDRFNLREIPEAIAVFSRGLLREIALETNDYSPIEPDIRFKFDTVEWRVAQVYPDGFVGNNPVHLHWTCVLERSSRFSYVKDQDFFYKDYNLYYAAGTNMTDVDILRSDLTNKNGSEIKLIVGSSSNLYLLYNSKFGDIVSVMKDGIDVLSDFTITTTDICGTTYNKYTAEASAYVGSTIKLMVNLNPHYK